MAETMRSAVVHAFGEPLTLEEVPVPAPGDGQVLVRIEACGVCHTGLHAAEGDWPVKPKLLCDYCLAGWETLCPSQQNAGYDDKLTLARTLGAEVTINARTMDPVVGIQRQIGGAHGALVSAVSPQAFGQAIGMLRRGGTCALVGLPSGDFATPIFDVVLKRLTIRGSIVGTRKDLQEALEFAAEGQVKATIETQPLSAINQVFDRLKPGDVQGRVVLEI